MGSGARTIGFPHQELTEKETAYMKYVSTNAESRARCVKPAEYLLTIPEAIEPSRKSPATR